MTLDVALLLLFLIACIAYLHWRVSFLEKQNHISNIAFENISKFLQSQYSVNDLIAKLLKEKK